MRVLILHSRYLSGDASGENRVVQDEAKLLADAGHEVRSWTPSASEAGGLDLVRTAAGAIWNRGAATLVRRLVREHEAQIVHCHNLTPALSPTVVRAASDAGASVIMTLHNYRLMCLPSTLLRDGRICEDCVGRTPWPGVIHACYRDSVAGSAVVATSVAIHRLARSHDRVQLFLAVSEFVRDRHVAAGLLPAERVVVKPNFAWSVPRRVGPGDRFVFVGRLSPEKGVGTLVDAWRAGAPGRLAIVGDGPERADLERNAPDDVEFLGSVPGDQVAELIRGARALMLPSIWYEAQPRVIPEAYAAGVPVIASRIGGLPDQVVDGETGMLVTPGDADGWAAAITALIDNGESARMGDAAHRRWVSTYSPERSLASLEGAYALARSRAGR